jgi:hypothetical protein
MLSQPKPREILRNAITERDLRQKRFDAAEVALARAELMLCEAEQNLSTFADVEEQIASHGANIVMASIGTGDKSANLSLPETIVARRTARDEAREIVATAKSAHKTLSNEQDAAKAPLAEANSSVCQASQLVMIEDAERIAARLQSAKREVWDLAAQLRGLSELWLPDKTTQSLRPFPLSPSIVDTIGTQEPQYAFAARPEVKHTTTWRSFYTELVVNPEAKFDGAL